MNARLRAIPVPAYFVRRRKYSGDAWLMARNTLYQIDAATDAIWVAVDGETSVAGVVEKFAASGKVDREEAETIALRTLEFLHGLGFISFREESED